MHDLETRHKESLTNLETRQRDNRRDAEHYRALYERLNAEHNELISHDNKQQKIKYSVKLKEDYNELHRKCVALQDENRRLRARTVPKPVADTADPDGLYREYRIASTALEDLASELVSIPVVQKLLPAAEGGARKEETAFQAVGVLRDFAARRDAEEAALRLQAEDLQLQVSSLQNKLHRVTMNCAQRSNLKENTPVNRGASAARKDMSVSPPGTPQAQGCG